MLAVTHEDLAKVDPHTFQAMLEADGWTFRRLPEAKPATVWNKGEALILVPTDPTFDDFKMRMSEAVTIFAEVSCQDPADLVRRLQRGLLDVRVMVCGSRNWGGFDPRKHYRPKNRAEHLQTHALLSMLDGLYEQHLVNCETITLVHGDCPTGADALAQRWAERKVGMAEPKRFPADWDAHGRAAGPIRNSQMIATLNADQGDYVVAAWDGTSRGTGDAVSKAESAGLQVVEVRVAGES